MSIRNKFIKLWWLTVEVLQHSSPVFALSSTCPRVSLISCPRASPGAFSCKNNGPQDTLIIALAFASLNMSVYVWQLPCSFNLIVLTIAWNILHRFFPRFTVWTLVDANCQKSEPVCRSELTEFTENFCVWWVQTPVCRGLCPSCTIPEVFNPALGDPSGSPGTGLKTSIFNENCQLKPADWHRVSQFAGCKLGQKSEQMLYSLFQPFSCKVTQS